MPDGKVQDKEVIMWVEKTKNGKYKYTERYVDPVTMKQKKACVTLDGNTRQDVKTAQFALSEKIKAVSAQSYQKQYVTLQTLKNDYIEWKYANLKEQTAQASDSKLNQILKLLGPDSRIDRLTAPYCKKKLHSDIPSKYNERLSQFKSMMRWGFQNDYISDISFLMKMPRAKAPTARVRDKYKYLEHEEIDLLLANSPRHWRLLSQFLILTGMRIGEAIALDIADVTDTEIRINKTYSIIIKKITSVKTDTSEREIFIQDELRECIREIEAYRLDVAKGSRSLRKIFFPGPDGNRIQYESYAKFFREKTQALFGRRLTPHALRHTHTALLAEAGIPLEQISRRLGHADSKVTRDVYMHVTEKMKERENERLKAVKLI